jgi:hypothetical protein
MKKVILKSFAILFGVILFQSCDSNNAIDQVTASVTHGAVLRTKTLVTKTFDFFDPSKQWQVNLEEQDEQNGALFASINVYAKKNTGGTEALIKNVSASTFTPGPNGLPIGSVKVSLAETLAALHLVSGQYVPTDQFFIRLEIVLTDGRTFSSNNASGTITGGSFFSSPFKYSVQFFCNLSNAALFSGDYKVTTDAWADYSVGDIVPVIPDPVDAMSFRILGTNNPFIDNPNDTYMKVTINPANGNVTVVSPVDMAYTGWLTIHVTGTGTVGTCTGSINLVVNFGPFTNNAFNLVKA